MNRDSLTYRQPITIRYAGHHYDGVLISARYRRCRRSMDDIIGTVEFSTRGGKRTIRREFCVVHGLDATEGKLRAILRAFIADKRAKLALPGTVEGTTR